eukprot:m51a1_g285 putative C-tail anchored protein (147) ;mRNA; r:329063-329503
MFGKARPPPPFLAGPRQTRLTPTQGKGEGRYANLEAKPEGMSWVDWRRAEYDRAHPGAPLPPARGAGEGGEEGPGAGEAEAWSPSVWERARMRMAPSAETRERADRCCRACGRRTCCASVCVAVVLVVLVGVALVLFIKVGLPILL